MLSTLNKIKYEQIISQISPFQTVELDHFLTNLDSQIASSYRFRNELIEHFLNSFLFYLKEGKSFSFICDIINPSRLNGFYNEFYPINLELDNDAVGYILSLKSNNFTVFRVAVNLCKNVSYEPLQMAADFAIKRFPIYSCVVKKGFFWPYLQTTNNLPKVKQDSSICAEIPASDTKFRSYNILYSGNTVALETSHVLTDANGALLFLKCIVREYARLTGENINFSEDYFDCQSDVCAEELIDAYKTVKVSTKEGKLIDGKTTHFDVPNNSAFSSKILFFDLNLDEVYSVAHKYNGTITAYLLSVLLFACKSCISSVKGDINIEVPVNVRKFYSTKTTRNFSMFSIIGKKISDIGFMKELVKDVDKQLKINCSKTRIENKIVSTTNLIRLTSFIPLSFKYFLMKILYARIDNSLYTTILSNLGNVDDASTTKCFIDNYEFVLFPWEDNRTMCTLLSYGKKLRFCVGARTSDDVFIQTIISLLQNDDIHILNK